MDQAELEDADVRMKRVQAQIDIDTHFQAPDTHRTARIWRNLRCIAVPSADASNDHFAPAAAAAAARGWPVATRRTGGLAVPHGVEVLCLSLKWFEPDPPGAGAAYGLLADLIRRSALALGVDADVGQVRGAVCPGAWDLAVQGRKFAGLAQRRTSRRPDGYVGVLAHAVVFCGLDFRSSVGAINSYYADLKTPRTFDPDAHENLTPPGGAPQLIEILQSSARQDGFRLL
jgi:hypothetical protein